MDWTQVLTIVGTNIVLLGGMIAVVVTLFVYGDKKADENRKALDASLKEYRKETNDILKAIQEEMKDFHSKLCVIDEKTKQNLIKT